MYETKTGVCKYCGQTRSIDVPTDSTEEYADNAVTEKCFCIGAAKERLKIKTIDNVNQVFGVECGGGFKPVEEDELSLIIQSAIAIVNGTADKITMSLKSGGNCKLKYKDIECIEVLREEKHVVKRSK